MRILVVDDEVDLAEAIATSLRRDGYAVDVVFNGADALERLAYTPYDLITLDLNLGDADGAEICRLIRTDDRFDSATRVLMVTARDTVADRVTGLDHGADDYLVKPFALPELSARVRSLMRRQASSTDAVMRVGRIELHAANHSVSAGGEELSLAAKEFALLRYFMTNAGAVLSQEHLLEHVWDEMADPFTSTVRVTVGTLRRKLTAALGESPIETIIGAGYRLNGEPNDS
jgi:DNA-binding response OmpR family regulator